MTHPTRVISLGIAGVIGHSAMANLLTNPGFESPPGNYVYVPGGSSYLPGWTTQQNGVEIFTKTDIGVGFPYPSTIAQGNQAVDLAPYIYNNGGISQSFPTVAGTQYNVSFKAATEQSWGKVGTGNVLSAIGTKAEVFPLANSGSDPVWQQKHFSFTATSTSSTLWLASADDPFQHYAFVDGVSVQASPVGGGSPGPNLLNNPSFESPAGNYEYVPGGSSHITGWQTQLNGVEVFTSTDVGLGVPFATTIGDGNKALDLTPFTYTGGGISQTFATVPGVSYDVSFLAATAQEFGRDGTGNVLAVIGSAVELFPLVNYNPDWVWEDKQYSFVAPDNNSTLWFFSTDNPWQHLAAIDDVSVEAELNAAPTAVPEGSTVGAAGALALLGLGARLRHNRRQ
jgi:hypothetical protein